MQVKRFSEIKGYDAPNHRACATLRVFGAEAGGTKGLIVGGKETVLKKHDSCFIGPDESREIVNRSNEVCSILVAIAPAPK